MKSAGKFTQQGFTLVELLIVVIILALLAAIVVPQFASSTEDAKVSSLDTTLTNVRSAVDLYYQQHGSYPSATIASGGTCAGTAGTGAKDSSQAFLDQMALYTNAAGLACSTKGDGTDPNAYPFGPYIKKSSLSANPITKKAALDIAIAGDLKLVPSTPGTPLGWRFDNLSGKFIADDDSLDANNIKYSDH